MAVTQNRVTGKPVPGSLTLGTKQKQPIYISVKDGRNNPEYLKSHPGQIIVLSEADFAKWLNQEYVSTDLSFETASAGQSLNDSETTDLFSTTIDKGILVPGKPSWDPTQIHFVMADSGIVENITITFDPSPSDPGDGSYTYHVDYEAVKHTANPTPSSVTTPPVTGVTPAPIVGSTGSSNNSNTSAQAASTTSAPVGTIITVNHTSSFFAISWNALSNVISYTVTVNGINVPYSSPTSGSTSFVIPSAGGNSSAGSIATGSLNFGIFTFVLNKLSGAFSGTYVVSVQANYAKGSSAGVTYNVTI